jgi:hypothetical protein
MEPISATVVPPGILRASGETAIVVNLMPERGTHDEDRALSWASQQDEDQSGQPMATHKRRRCRTACPSRLTQVARPTPDW